MKGLLRHMMPVLLRERDPDAEEWHSSVVLNVREEEEIVVGVPIERGFEMPITEGARVLVQTSHPDGIRRFVSTVRRRRDVPSPCLYLSWPEDVERIQRRRHVRIDVRVPVTIRVALAADQPRRMLRGWTADLSAGGAKIDLPEPVAPGLAFSLELRLPEQRTLTCDARVAHAGQKAPVRGVARPWAGVEFTGISGPDRRQLARFVLDTQREQIRRELL